MSIKRSAVKLTLERVLVAYPKDCKPQYEWKFRQSIYTRKSWETFEIPIVYGGAGVYAAYLEDEQDIESWKERLKDKALQELQEMVHNLEKQIDSLENVEWAEN